MAPSSSARTHSRAILAELLGTMLLTLTTNVLMGADDLSIVAKALGTGAAYTALISVTGALLNPAATLTAACKGALSAHVAIIHALLQITGAALGGMLQTLLVPGVRFGHRGPGCLSTDTGTLVHVAGWETLLTALLVASYDAPLAVGASQLLATLTGMLHAK